MKWWKKPAALVVGGVAVFSLLIAGLVRAGYLGGAPQPAGATIELDKGLVGYWKLDGNAKDSSPYADDGTVTGASLTTDRKGVSNAAYSLDGTSNNITFPDNTAMQSGSMTASFWFKLTTDPECDANNNWRSLIRKGSADSASTSGWDVVLEQNKGVQFDIGYSGVTHRSGGVSVGMAVGTPILLTFSYDSSSGAVKIYANGVIQSSQTIAATPIAASTAVLALGKGANAVSCPNGDGYTPGVYDDVRIYNRALTQAEVTALTGQYGSGVVAASTQKGLTGWWKMDGDAKDSTPNANTGAITSASLATDRKGVSNSAYSFNGTSSLINISNSTPLKPTSAISVSMWISPSNVSSISEQKPLSATEGGSYAIAITGSSADGSCVASRLCFFLNIAGTYRVVQVDKTTALSNGTWALVTATYNGSTLTLYVNGSSVDSGSYSGSITEVSTPLCLGSEATAASCSGGQNYAGSMDDVRIYDHGLTASEVTSLYQTYGGGAVGSNMLKGLVGQWDLNGNAKDATPYAKNGTLNNAPSLTTDRKGQSNKAYQFNGTNSNITVTGSGVATSAVTVSAWVNQTGLVDYYDLVTNSWCSDGGWLLYTRGNGQVLFGVSGASCAQSNATCAASTMTTGAWHHLVGTYDGTTVKVYYDGSVCPTTASLSGKTLISSGSIRFGEQPDGTTHSMDDIRIWNRALTASEVTQLYQEYR